MDNQVTKYIKKFLTKEECKLQLVEPHNHRINAAKRTIQTFKDAFISALATTDLDFPLQLWDRLTPQVLNHLNMMRASQINPSKSVYETLYGPYNRNRYPLAKLGCKAIVYKDGNTRGMWTSRDVGGWYLSPSMDHYCCDVYYIPETRAYHISGSTELFPQHCQLPDMSPPQHLRALTDKISKLAPLAKDTPKGKHLLRLLQTRVRTLLNPPLVIQVEQRVDQPINAHVAQQRVIDEAPIITISRITEAPEIIKLRNPAAKCTLKTTPRLHHLVTRNNRPGIMPVPTVVPAVPQLAAVKTYHPILSGAHSRILTQHAINALTATKIKNYQDIFAPHILSNAAPSRTAIQPVHVPWYIPSPAIQFQVTKTDE